MKKPSKQEIKGVIAPETPIEQEVITEKEQPPSSLEKIQPAPAPLLKEAATLAPRPLPPPALLKDPQLMKIENILSEGLDNLYRTMQPEEQKRFKEKGEETASKIQQLIKAVKIQTRKILELIKAWLRLIPRVNKFFLEQEAKIKTDKILAMADEKIEK
jgi:hypothetical protein